MIHGGFLYWIDFISLVIDFRLLTFDLKLYIVNLMYKK